MGKKSKILYYSVLIVNVICFLLDLITDFTDINFTFFRLSFAVSLMLIGLLLIARAVKLKLDSSMFIGIILFWFGVFNGLQYFAIAFDWDMITTLRILPYYLFSVSLASLVTGIYFKHKLQIKLFILFFGFGIITLLFSLKLLGLGWYIALMASWFVVYFITNLVIFKKRSN